MAKRLRTQLVVGLTDKASAPANRIATAMARLKAISKMNIAQRMGVAATSMKRSSVAATGLSVGLGLVARQGFMAVYSMEKVMNKMQAVGQLTIDQRKEFLALAKVLNKDFPFTNKEIAEAGVELMKAGFNFEQAKGALKSTLQLAMAGDIDRGEAADIATNVLTAMRLPMETAEQVERSLKRVVDNLSYAATKSNTDIQKMGETFKYVAPIAAAAGISIEKVSAMSMVMANNGIKASEAGVALRSGIIKMVRPTTFALKAFDRLNINIGEFIKRGRKVKSSDIIGGLKLDGIDAAPMKKAIDKILDDDALQNKPAQLASRLTQTISEGLGHDSAIDKKSIAEAMQSIVLSSASEVDLLGIMGELMKKGATLKEVAEIFGVKQSGRLMTLLTADLNEKTKEVIRNSKNATERMAAIMMGGIVGQVAKLKASWENLWQTIGEAGVLHDISMAFNKIAIALESISKSNPALLKFATYAIGTAAVLGPLGFMITGVAASVSMLTAGLSMAGLGVAGFGRVLAGPFIAAAVGARKQLLLLNAAAMIQGGGRLKLLAGSFLSLLNPLRMIKATGRGALGALRSLGSTALLLGAISWPALLGVGAIAGVIGYWRELQAFFKGFFTGIDDAFQAEGLGRPLQALGEIAKSLMGYFGGITNYIKELFNFGSNKSDLISWFSAGRGAAEAMAKAVKAILSPLIALKNLLTTGSFKGAPAAGKGQKIEGRARGGNVRAGQTVVVGEEGPELARFSRNTHITPNKQFMNKLSSGGRSSGRSMSVGNISVTVNANSPVNNARQLGQELGKAVRNEIANSYSDGGFA